MSGNQLGSRWTWGPTWTSCFSRSNPVSCFPGPKNDFSFRSKTVFFPDQSQTPVSCFPKTVFQVPPAAALSSFGNSWSLFFFLFFFYWPNQVTLLDDPSNTGAISWTGRGMEFKLIEPEEVNIAQRFH